MKPFRIIGLCAVACLLLSASVFAQSSPDKAYLQKIWTGWATMNAENQTQFYAQGPHVFFDDAPLKYDSWDEYEKTVGKELTEYKSAKFKVNDDAQIHQAGSVYWGSSTVDFVMVRKDGKEEKGTFRWTFVFEQQNGKWLIVHEHVSVPAA